MPDMMNDNGSYFRFYVLSNQTLSLAAELSTEIALRSTKLLGHLLAT
jgi:hypothetical protein